MDQTLNNSSASYDSYVASGVAPPTRAQGAFKSTIIATQQQCEKYNYKYLEIHISVPS